LLNKCLNNNKASKIQVSSIFPRCASIQGGTALTLTVPNLDDKTATTLNHLTVGFQAKQFRKEDLQLANNVKLFIFICIFIIFYFINLSDCLFRKNNFLKSPIVLLLENISIKIKIKSL